MALRLKPVKKAVDNYAAADRELTQASWDAANIRLAQTYRVVLSNPSRILLDLDDDAAYTKYKEVSAIVAEHFPHIVELDAPSKSGLPHRHVVLHLRNPIESFTARLALAAVMGHDPKAVMWSLRRLAGGTVEPGRLFQPKETK